MYNVLCYFICKLEFQWNPEPESTSNHRIKPMRSQPLPIFGIAWLSCLALKSDCSGHSPGLSLLVQPWHLADLRIRFTLPIPPPESRPQLLGPHRFPLRKKHAAQPRDRLGTTAQPYLRGRRRSLRVWLAPSTWGWRQDVVKEGLRRAYPQPSSSMEW